MKRELLAAPFLQNDVPCLLLDLLFSSTESSLGGCISQQSAEIDTFFTLPSGTQTVKASEMIRHLTMRGGSVTPTTSFRTLFQFYNERWIQMSSVTSTTCFGTLFWCYRLPVILKNCHFHVSLRPLVSTSHPGVTDIVSP